MATESWLLPCVASISCPTFVFLVIGALSVTFLLTKLRITEPQGLEWRTNFQTGKTSLRKLDAANFEKGTFDHLYTFGMALVSDVVFIDSAARLDSSALRKALVMLMERYPMLRMKFEWTETKTHRYLTEMEYPNICLSEEGTQQWQERMEDELQMPFDSSVGPLWRVTRLRENYNHHNNKYRNTLLFTFHHSICDGLSIMTLLKQFLECLEQCLGGTEETNKVESMQILPPLQDLVKHNITLPWWGALLFLVKMKFTQLVNSLHQSRNLYLQKFPPVLATNPSIVKKTCFIPMMLSEEETQNLTTQCKAHKCTVTGALTASAVLAVREILHSGAIKPSMAVGIGFPVNIRQDCQPAVSKEHFGTFISPLPCTFILRQSESIDFWELSQNVSENIDGRLRKKEHYNYLRMIKYNGMKPAEEFLKVSQDEANAGRWQGLLEISNCGKFELGKTVAGTVEFVGTHFVVAQHFCGSLITNNFVTVNGRLSWTVVFSSHVMTHEQAKEFSNLALKILKQSVSN